MNKALSPLVVAGIAVAALVALVLVGLRVTQPAPYTPSPGVVSGPHPGDPSAAVARGNSPMGSPGSPTSPGGK